MPLLTTARVPIWYSEHNPAPPAQQPPLLLVHGAGGTHEDWSAALRTLPNTRVIAPDLPGHGSSPEPGRASVADYAADMVALLDALGIDRAVIGGHSMGGAVALTLALEHTARAAGLVLVGTGAKLGVHPDILNKVYTDLPGVARTITAWAWAEGLEAQVYANSYAGILANNPDVLYHDYAACNAFDVRARLGEIRVPVLVVGGTADRMAAYKYSEYLRDQIADATLFTVQGGGHMLALEQPQVVADAVRDWLKQCDPR